MRLYVCTLIFLIEMIAKVSAPCFGDKDMGENDGAQGGTFARLRAGWKRYWHNGWNMLDGILVILALPSLVITLIPSMSTMFSADLSILMILRLLRTLRFFRFLRFLGSDGIEELSRGFVRAMKMSRSVLAAFFVIILIFGLIEEKLDSLMKMLEQSE